MINNRHGPRGKPQWFYHSTRGAPIQSVRSRGRPPTGTITMDHVTGLKKPEQERYGRWKVAVFLNADRSGDAVRLRKGNSICQRA